ncbi:MAG TPA: thymidylate kinase [Candidatus Methylomirabilis sp.]|nr:thymidylate kinase [Candidatus Methylomirabilis sp.]
MSPKRTYGMAPAGVDPDTLSGTLIVIEGPDSSGRSTQVALLAQWLEEQGYAVAQVGLKRSTLVGPELEQAKQGNILSPRTLSLFYATDFYDQLENRIVPSLRAGFVVLADRYIYTLIARAIVRGADPEWVASVYSMAIVPDAVFYMTASFTTLVQRTFQAHTELDYWESGMDCGLSRDWFQSFVRYQRRIRSEFFKMQKKYAFELVNANRSVAAVDRDLKGRIQLVLDRAEKPEERRVRRARVR